MFLARQALPPGCVFYFFQFGSNEQRTSILRVFQIDDYDDGAALDLGNGKKIRTETGGKTSNKERKKQKVGSFQPF